MVLKLTHAVKNVPTLVNMDNVQTMYVVSDVRGNFPTSTKILFTNEQYVNVSEDLQTILQMVHEYEQGKYQSTDFVTPEETNVPSPQNRFERQYYAGRRERNYNSVRSYNDDQF